MAEAQSEKDFYNSQGFYGAFNKILVEVNEIFEQERLAIERKERAKLRE